MLNKKPQRVTKCFAVFSKKLLKTMSTPRQPVTYPSGTTLMRVSPVTGVSYYTVP